MQSHNTSFTVVHPLPRLRPQIFGYNLFIMAIPKPQRCTLYNSPQSSQDLLRGRLDHTRLLSLWSNLQYLPSLLLSNSKDYKSGSYRKILQIAIKTRLFLKILYICLSSSSLSGLALPSSMRPRYLYLYISAH
jgi:hypothetical protein